MDFHSVRNLGIQKGFQVERSLASKRVRISFKGARMRRPDGTVSYSFKGAIASVDLILLSAPGAPAISAGVIFSARASR